MPEKKPQNYQKWKQVTISDIPRSHIMVPATVGRFYPASTTKTLKNTDRIYQILCNAVFILALFFPLTESNAEARKLADKNLLIVGIVLNGVAAQDWDIYHTGSTYWISRKDLETNLNLRFSGNPPEPLTINSPLGITSIPAEETATNELDGLYISTKALRNKLNIQSKFIDETYSLSLDVPWTEETSGKKKRHERNVDFFAPSGALSSVSYESQLRLTRSSSIESLNNLLTTGSVGNGFWLLSFSETDDNEIVPESYHWTVNTGHSLLRLGTNQAEISSLTPRMEFTGLQFAWSKSGIEKYVTDEHSLDLDGFISDDVDLLKSIKRDDGHPAGIAVLNIDGYRVAAVRIGLDGRYEFNNVVYNTDQYQSVHIHIYESSASRKPLKIVNISRHTARKMLESGEHFLRFGIGTSVTGTTMDTDGDQRFLLYRFGATNRLTFHIGTQANRTAETDHTASVAGMMASLGDHWALETELATKADSHAITASLSGEYQDFNSEFRIKTAHDIVNNVENSAIRKHDARWRTFWRIHPQVKLGLFGRHWKDSVSTDNRYILPAVFGNVTDRFNFYARPEETGDYQLSANYHYNDQRFQVTHSINAYSLIRHTIYKNRWRTWHFTAEQDHTQDSDIQLTAQLDWYPTQNYQNFIELGYTHSDLKKGGYFSWNTYTRPGIDIQMRYEHYTSFDAEPTQSFWLRTRLNLAKSGEKYMPTENRQNNLRLGSISGELVNADGVRLDLNGVTMRVNGKTLTDQATNGRYAINNLKPGIYDVSVDEDDLPIELVPEKNTAVVEVKASAVTNVDFRIDKFYGFAGLVTRNKVPLKNTRLRVSGSKKQLIRYVSSDDFGYYRINDLPPGQYQIEAIDQPGITVSVTLTDDFMFDQNISL